MGNKVLNEVSIIPEAIDLMVSGHFLISKLYKYFQEMPSTFPSGYSLHHTKDFPRKDTFGYQVFNNHTIHLLQVE